MENLSFKPGRPSNMFAVMFCIGIALYKPSLTSLSKYQYINNILFIMYCKGTALPSLTSLYQYINNILFIMYCKGTALYKPSLISLSKYQYIKQYILLIMYFKGTALYKPSLTSLSKYQYKTPDYTKPQPQVI